MNELTDKQKEGLAKLLEPFSMGEISKLPKPTKAQTDAVKANFKVGIRCKLCGGWHHKDVVHLDYVGHAAVTARLLKVDPLYNWEPYAVNEFGLPAIDKDGGLWIKLTVCGVTRPGYGGADGKRGTDATKELIGDALRNAGMRFGMALDLWHKGDALFFSDDSEQPPVETAPSPAIEKTTLTDARLDAAITKIIAGEYTKKSLLENFSLTVAQTERLNKELKND